MARSRIGTDLEDFRLPVKSGLRQAADLQFSCVEVPAASGEITPSQLSGSGRRDLIRFASNLGLDLCALTADIPNTRLTDPATTQQRVEGTRAIIELAADLKVPVVTASVGALTHPDTGEPSPLALEALQHIGECAYATGRIFAIRPSCDPADRLAELIGQLGCPAIRVGIDPAGMVMAGVDPAQVVERLAEDIALVHARDATIGGADRMGHETALGEGEVDLVGLFDLLAEADYVGPWIVRRCHARNPPAEISQAREWLESHLPG